MTSEISANMTHRNGGDLVIETLEALGAKTVFGIPGQHALGLFDALSRSDLHFVSSRVENNSAFAADGYSRATGEVGVLFLSTGPGALTSLAGLQEAYATGVPIVVVASQIPLDGLGARRKGMLHQLDDQKASAANVTKSQRTVHHASGIPSAIQDAWADAITVPQGPVWVEVPQDVLLAPVLGSARRRRAGRSLRAPAAGGTCQRGGALAFRRPAPGHRRRRRRPPRPRRGRAAGRRRAPGRPCHLFPRRQRSLPLEPRAFAAVVGRGPARHGGPRGRRRAHRRRLGAWAK